MTAAPSTGTAGGHRKRRGRPRGGRSCLALLFALGIVGPRGLAAQELPPDREEQLPNPLLTFSLAPGITLSRNPALEPGGSATEVRLETDLGLSLVSETPISVLEVAADAVLSLAPASEDAGDALSVDGPELRFSYDRVVPSASLGLSGTLDQSDVAAVTGLDDFVDDDGTIDLPDEFEDLEGGGTRRSATLDALLTLRDDAPFGVELSAGVEVVDYEGVTSPDLADYRSLDLGVAFRFDLTDVAQLRAGLRGSTYDEDGAERLTSLGFDLEGTIERPDGRFSASLALDETEDGLLSTVTVGRVVERPLGTLSGEVGVTRGTDGESILTGQLGITRDFPTGSVSATFGQSVDITGSGDQEVETTLTAGWVQELDPVTSLSIDALYSDVRDLATDEEVRNLELGAALSRQVTRDWAMEVEYRHRLRDEAGVDRATGDSLFLGLSRSFQGGF